MFRGRESKVFRQEILWWKEKMAARTATTVTVMMAAKRGQRSRNPAPSRKMRWMSSRPYLMGLSRVRSWKISGMLEMGVAKPESMTMGTSSRKVPTMACWRDWAKEEMHSPMAAAVTMKSRRAAESSQTDPWELVWVHFNGATSREYYRYFSSISAPAFEPHSFPELRLKLDSLLDANTVSDFQAEITSSRLIVDILSILLQDITESREENHPGRLKMTEIRAYLDEHYTEKFSLDQLSDQFFISKYHLSREFHQYYGITLNQYVIARRLTRAKKLLRFSDFSLEEIARSCGFYDASYLNRQFKNSEGVTASEFRKKWMN